MYLFLYFVLFFTGKLEKISRRKGETGTVWNTETSQTKICMLVLLFINKPDKNICMLILLFINKPSLTKICMLILLLRNKPSQAKNCMFFCFLAHFCYLAWSSGFCKTCKFEEGGGPNNCCHYPINSMFCSFVNWFGEWLFDYKFMYAKKIKKYWKYYFS